MTLGGIDLHFAWQAWHLRHWAGSGGALGSGGAAAVCVAGVALGDIDLHLAWQAWRLALCVAGVALMALWWRAWVWRAPQWFA